ncbi:single-stranded-DNA-specific exonuclease RecJ [Methanocella arvoryzae]|uniref:Single-stranded DNA-specific exonuclease n=1 Tax=Methanocella arvoryzae (strain DSM 22066 / NBRC 105507 / MRE50) TaxID=351160 RepID=Q0W306_METAR|nr:DHH family phosphoesterase [Methanocella arvoryzae]CAJ37237.1 putative single-stranded DNA-specific exonuclease [Methanocella arvoryzae MRE50]
MERFSQAAERCADLIKKSDELLVVSHIDADGLTSAGIICTALQRLGKGYDTRFVKKLDAEALKQIAAIAGKRTVIFTDLGSGAIDQINELGLTAVIADHHQPKPSDYPYHLNPHLVGLNGATDISGSGVTFLLALKLGPNEDLSSLAIVGAVGDLQDMRTNALVGVNRQILTLGVSGGYLSFEKDIKLFGRQTRPVYKLLQYCSDPYMPGLSGCEEACVTFLENAGIPVKAESWRRWIDLSRDEKTRVISSLFQHCMACGMPSHKIQRLVGEVYTLCKEEPGTEMRDASEFSTLLNATARYEYAETGLAICTGDRGEAFHYARDLLEQHRRNLVNGLNYVSDHGVTRLNNVQYFDARSEIRETIVGIIAGMSSSLDCVSRGMPIVGLATSTEGIKVSARGNHDLIMRGLNLARAISEAAAAVGGAGGGHDIAAGATIPAGKEVEFMALLDQKIGEQIKSKL